MINQQYNYKFFIIFLTCKHNFKIIFYFIFQVFKNKISTKFDILTNFLKPISVIFNKRYFFFKVIFLLFDILILCSYKI